MIGSALFSSLAASTTPSAGGPLASAPAVAPCLGRAIEARAVDGSWRPRTPPARQSHARGGGDDGADRNHVRALSLSDPLAWTESMPGGIPRPGLSEHTATCDRAGDRVIVYGIPACGRPRSRGPVARREPIRLDVLDVAGRLVETLFEGVQDPGRHSVAWEAGAGAARCPAGVYFVRWRSPGLTMSRRVVLLP